MSDLVSFIPVSLPLESLSVFIAVINVLTSLNPLTTPFLSAIVISPARRSNTASLIILPLKYLPVSTSVLDTISILPSLVPSEIKTTSFAASPL